MELLQLQYFLKTAELEHMTRAAEALSIAQPALSKSIRLLEEELGVQLFNRVGKYIQLNACGRAFQYRVNNALAELLVGKREIMRMSDPNEAPIRLAFLAASPVLPDLLATFRAEHPEVNFHLLQHLPKPYSDDFDLCISSLPLEAHGLSRILLMSERFYLAVPRHHPLSRQKKISLKEVAQEGFIQLKPGNSLRTITDGFCREAGFTPRTIYESDDPATLRGLIRAGQGIGFFPAITWLEKEGPNIQLLEIAEPLCKRDIWMSWVESRIYSERFVLFRQYVTDYFNKLVSGAEVI